MQCLLSSLTAAFLFAFVPGSSMLAKDAKAAIPDYDYREGDIVFQGNAGHQGDAIRAATDSPFTHCGIVFRKDGRLMVIEAVHPVQVTLLDDFAKRSLPGTFKAMRLKQPLDRAALAKGRIWAASQAGLPYDLQFRWDDLKLYCSEFVWKAYQKAGTRLCEPRRFRSYQLDKPIVQRIIKQRYGSVDKLPLDEPAVSPGDLAVSKLLVEVPRVAAKK